MKPKIMYLDDEQNNLHVFRYSSPPEWDLYLFTDPNKALAELHRINPWVIASDQKMPILTGIEFLKKAIQISPLSVTMIVTGYSDEDLFIEALKDAQIRDFLKKPYAKESLVSSVESAIKIYHKREGDLSNRKLILKIDQDLSQTLNVTPTNEDCEKCPEKEALLRISNLISNKSDFPGTT